MGETNKDLIAKAQNTFVRKFGVEPVATAFAPGRVNLLGEHTDYNGGFVLPMPLNLGTAVAIGPASEPARVRILSDSFDEVVLRNISEGPAGAWHDYVLGSLKYGAEEHIAKTGIRVVVASNLPVGSGLSSSAAVEVACLRAASDAFQTESDPVEVAKTARRAENNFVGVPCGIMDQFSVSVGQPGQALFLDTRTLNYSPAKLPENHSFMVIHSGLDHKLTDDGYAQRVAQCNAAAQALQVECLSDLSCNDLERIALLPEPLNLRARHIVTENQRVRDGLSALNSNRFHDFAVLMNGSHASQRDDYAVSLPQIDALVDGVRRAGADSARLTGGGFGGSIVALVANDTIPSVERTVAEHFPAARVLAKI